MSKLHDQDYPDPLALRMSSPTPLTVRLLAENRRFSPLLRGGSICNHYSMAILSAHRLGASDEQIERLHNQIGDTRSRVPHNHGSGATPVTQAS